MLLARWAVLRTGGSLVRPQAWLERPSPCAGDVPPREEQGAWPVWSAVWWLPEPASGVLPLTVSRVAVSAGGW